MATTISPAKPSEKEIAKEIGADGKWRSAEHSE
jgi:hypothetical protein